MRVIERRESKNIFYIYAIFLPTFPIILTFFLSPFPLKFSLILSIFYLSISGYHNFSILYT